MGSKTFSRGHQPSFAPAFAAASRATSHPSPGPFRRGSVPRRRRRRHRRPDLYFFLSVFSFLFSPVPHRATTRSSSMVLHSDIDLLNPPASVVKDQHKLKRLVQSPNSFFMDVKCQGCFNITTVFSHSQSVVVCGTCAAVLCQPTGGRARLTEGCSFRKKVE